jgi:putative tryptophan/tyrosine transport system substrate-binding protein
VPSFLSKCVWRVPLAPARLATTLVFLSAAWLLPAEAQTPVKIYRIGVLADTPFRDPQYQSASDAFLAGLSEFGYVEGQNIQFEWRNSGGHAEQYPELAAELVSVKVDLIMVSTTPAALAARVATNTIPIFFIGAHDPVGAGLATSLARPGGNVTGLATLFPELSTKRLELLKQLVPRMSHVAVLWNGANPANVLALRQTEDAARQLGIALRLHDVRTPEEFEARFAMIAQQRPDALFVLGDSLTLRRRHDIARFALQAHLRSSFESKESAVAGGLMRYGPSYIAMWRRAGFYVDRLLKGVRPADLPFEQPSKFQFVINMKTSRNLRLSVPQSLLLQADEVIE